MALWRAGQIQPRVLNVDGHASYPPAVAELKQTGETEPRVPMPPLSLLEQCAGARSSFRQEARRGEPVVPIGGRRVADYRRVRSDEHDPERAGEVAGERRCGWVSSLY